jgi:hypothetical protein
MVAYGDLQFEEQDLFGIYFGNIAAYTLSFMRKWFLQLNKEVPRGKRFYPSQPKAKVRLEVPYNQRVEKWRKYCLNGRTRGFRSHFRNVQADIHHTIANLMVYKQKYKTKYEKKSQFFLCNNWHFLYVYREALRIEEMYRVGKFPLLYHERQLRCLPYRQSEDKLKTELTDALLKKTIEKPAAVNERLECANEY